MRKEASAFLDSGFRIAAEWSPDGRWLLVHRGRIGSIASREMAASLAPAFQPPTGEQPFSPRFSRDGQSIYYSVITGPRENHDFWKLSLGDGKISRLTKLEGRRGNIGNAFATAIATCISPGEKTRATSGSWMW